MPNSALSPRPRPGRGRIGERSEGGAEERTALEGIFMLEEAKLILGATLDTPNHLISVEMRHLAARDIWCMVIKPSLEKTAQQHVVPIHSYVIAQGFLRLGGRFWHPRVKRRRLH